MVETATEGNIMFLKNSKNERELKIFLTEDKCLYFELVPSGIKKVEFKVTDSSLSELLNELYSITVKKYGFCETDPIQREHDRVYVYGEYKLLNRETSTITWYSSETFNQFGNLSEIGNFSSVKPQSFAVTRTKSDFKITAINLNLKEPFVIVPRNLGGTYYGIPSRGRADFREDLLNFYSKALLLDKKNFVDGNPKVKK